VHAYVFYGGPGGETFGSAGSWDRAGLLTPSSGPPPSFSSERRASINLSPEATWLPHSAGIAPRLTLPLHLGAAGFPHNREVPHVPD